jgi:hypothetical protein
LSLLATHVLKHQFSLLLYVDFVLSLDLTEHGKSRFRSEFKTTATCGANGSHSSHPGSEMSWVPTSSARLLNFEPPHVPS